MPRPTTQLPLTLLLTCFCFIFTPQVKAQDSVQDELRPVSFTSEGWGRSWATKKVLPTYPAEAVARNLQGVVEVGVGINDDGQVIKVRVPPGLNLLFRKAAVTAVKQWKFRPWDNKMPPGAYCIFRLTFNFVIEEGTPRVELYNPPYDTPEHRRFRGASNRDRKEWLSWEDATDDN